MGIAGSRPTLQLSLALLALLTCAGSSAGAQTVRYSHDHLDHERTVPMSVTGGSAKLRAKIAAGTALSLVSADFDSDGTPDIVSGYATAAGGAFLLERGSPIAQAPTPHEWAMLAAGELVTPYVANAEAMELPVRPDLLKSADVHGHGFNDLIFAQRADSALYLAFSDGRGTFAAPAAVPLAGSIHSLTTWRAQSGENLLVAGVCGARGCGLQFLDRDGATRAFIATPAAVTSIEAGNIDNGSRTDLVLIAAGQVLVLDGDTVFDGKPTLETLPVSSAAAIALGSFVPDRHPGLQIAVLSHGAVLHVFTRAGIDSSFHPELHHAQAQARLARLAEGNAPNHRAQTQPRPKRSGLPWTEAETVSGIGSGGAAIMFRAHLTAGGNDDLAVITGTQYTTVAHPLKLEAGLFKTVPAVTIDAVSTPVAAAIPARVSATARSGVVTLASGGVRPLTVMIPPTKRTLYVNTNTDGTPTTVSENLCINQNPGCTLRSALTVANLDRGANGEASVDVVNVAANTYTLSAINVDSAGNAQNPDFEGSVNYHLQIDASIDLIGAGTANTIINANNIDQTISINQGAFYSTYEGDFQPSALDAFISALTIENGKNPNTGTTAGCQASDECNVYGGNMSFIVEGSSNLVLNSVNVTTGNSPYAGGGGLYAFYNNSFSATQAGPIEIDNSTFSSNTTNNVGGGAIQLDVESSAQYETPLILTNDIIMSNTANGDGGGLLGSSDPGLFTITGTTFSNNSVMAGQNYGGGLFTATPITIANSVFSSNTGGVFGGGAYLGGPTFTQTVTTSSFLNNKLNTSTNTGYPYSQDGGGLCLQAGQNSSQGVYTVSYSRFHGNTGGHSTGMGVGCGSDTSSSQQARVTATDNWWGCLPTTANNTAGIGAAAIAGTGCDTAGEGNVQSGSTLTVSPYTTLTLSLSASTVNVGSTFNATASWGQDSSGTVYSGAQVAGYNQALNPITTFTLSDSSNTTYSPSATNFANLSSGGTSTTSTQCAGYISCSTSVATGTGGSAGSGTATLTVDSTTLTKSYMVVGVPDLTVTSTHTGNFKAGDAADTYSLSVGNIGTGPTNTNGVTVKDTLPSGFTATAISGSGWTCTLATVSCVRYDALGSSVTYPVVTVTFGVSSADAGTYTNSASVSGGGETNTNNDNSNDPTIVVGQPTITEAFSPTTVAPNATSTLTFTLGNSSANPVSLTGVAFSDTFPTGLRVVTAAATNCSGGTAMGAVSATAVSLSGATIAAGATCTLTVGVQAVSIGSYPNTSGTVTATNSNAGGTASATLTVNVTPTRVIFSTVPPSPITAGGNAGSVQVALEDGSGNVATNNSTATVTLAVTGPSGSGYSQTYGPYTVTNGVYTLNLSSVPLTVAGAYTYTATSSGLTNGTASETVNPGAAAALVVTGLTTFTAPGETQTVSVRVNDSYGNVVTGFTGTVTLSSTDALATFSPTTYTYTAGDAGVHTFSVTLGTAGTQTVTSTSGALVGSEPLITVLDAILVTNPEGSVSRLTDAGVATTSTSGFTGGGTPTAGAAIDFTGNIFSLNTTGNLLVEFSKLGTVLSGSGFAGGGLNAPAVLAVDGLGQVWIGNGNGTVSEFSNTGTAVSPAAGYPAGSAAATGVAIDTSGNVWTSTSSAVVEILGGAAPVNPLAIAVKTVTLGARP